MRIEYDRDTCIGIYQCVDEWSKFEKDMDAGKAELVDAEETVEDTFVLDVPDGEEFDAEMAARVCPVDAITLYDDDGEQMVP
ncbi:MAG: ferredoxin [Euryarchaeota archaeon]|nr:ferredoxin [Euryarchaeota archaeon]